MEPLQIVLIGISIVLTSLFIALGIQVWFILREMRRAFEKMNKMLDDATKITGAVGEGFSNVNGLVSGLKAGLSLATSLRKKGDKDDD